MNIKTPVRPLKKKVNEATHIDADGNIVCARAMANALNWLAGRVEKLEEKECKQK